MKNICNIVKRRAKVHNMQSASALSSVKKKKKKYKENGSWKLVASGWKKRCSMSQEAVLFFCKIG